MVDQKFIVFANLWYRNAQNRFSISVARGLLLYATNVERVTMSHENAPKMLTFQHAVSVDR